MARVPMYKVSLLVPKSESLSLLSKLQEGGFFHIESKADEYHDVHELALVTDYLTRVERLLGVVLPYRKVEKSPIEMFAQIKHPFFLNAKSLEEKAQYVMDHIQEIEDELNTIRSEENKIKEENRKIEDLIERLSPFKDVHVKLSELGVGSKVEAYFTSIRKPIPKVNGVQLEIVKESPDEVLAFMIKLKDVKFDHSPLDLPNVPYTPAQYLKYLESHRPDLSRVEKLKKEFAKKWMEYLVAAHDYLDTLKSRWLAFSSSNRTSRTIYIQGWIPQKFRSKMDRILKDQLGDAYYVHYEKPKKGDRVPVILSNTWAKPFETVTKSFGLPNYFESDPTPFLAPFFLLFTGLCLTDAVYGIALAVVGYILRSKFPSFKRFFTLITYIGISTFVMGALFGGWMGGVFGVLTDGQFDIKPLLIDALADPMAFLGLSLALGVIHLTLGIIIEAYDQWRQGDPFGAIVDNISWIFLVYGILLYGGVSAGALPSQLNLLSVGMAGLGAGALVLFQGRSESNVLKRLGIGVISLYGLIGFMSDVLSYSRILALGLATGVIGLVVNQLAKMVMGIPYIGVIPLVIVLIIGHVFNLVLSALGSYIHSSRLQYVEFFGRFLEGGGVKYNPLKRGDKYTEIKEV